MVEKLCKKCGRVANKIGLKPGDGGVVKDKGIKRHKNKFFKKFKYWDAE